MKSLSSFFNLSLTRAEMNGVKGGGACGYQQVVTQSIWNSYTNSWSTVGTTKWVQASYNNGISKQNAKQNAAANGTHWCCDSCPWNNTWT
jgi:hypothetical protein